MIWRKNAASLLSDLAWMAVAWLLLMGLALSLAAISGGCTVAPRPVRNAQASFDGDQQNSGLIGYDAQGRRIISRHALERYNALIARYGAKFTPPLQPNAELLFLTSTNTAILNAQGAFYFETMNRWAHQELPPWIK